MECEKKLDLVRVFKSDGVIENRWYGMNNFYTNIYILTRDHGGTWCQNTSEVQHTFALSDDGRKSLKH